MTRGESAERLRELDEEDERRIKEKLEEELG